MKKRKTVAAMLPRLFVSSPCGDAPHMIRKQPQRSRKKHAIMSKSSKKRIFYDFSRSD
jgi:hypothetical protein